MPVDGIADDIERIDPKTARVYAYAAPPQSKRDWLAVRVEGETPNERATNRNVSVSNVTENIRRAERHIAAEYAVRNGVRAYPLDAPPCPECDQNRNGIFTTRTGASHVSHRCERCGHRWTDEGIYIRHEDTPNP